MRVLLIEGGGMKAAYANGVLTAFEEAGYQPWDAVLGTSAGGAMAAWYSAGQAKFAQGTWKYASDPRILSMRRALRGGPVLDHETLLDVVYRQEHPLDGDALQKTKWPVLVTVADVDTGAVVYQDIRNDRALDWIKATGRLPLGSGPPVEIAGRSYLDGGTIDPIPIRHVCEVMGATHVTLIMNKIPKPKRSDVRVVASLAARRYPALRGGIMNHDAIKVASYAYARAPPPGRQIDIVSPSQALRVRRFTRDQGIIQEALDLGYADGQQFVSARVKSP